MSEKIERFYQVELRAENDTEHGDYVSGRPIVYNAPTVIGGAFNEIIERGALDMADLTDVPLFINHEPNRIPLARSRNNNANSTMQMQVDVEGLTIRANLDTERNADAKSLYSAIDRQDIYGMSFAFTVEAEEWDNLDTDMPTRHIRSIGKVYEVSAVTFPAYNQTSINARAAETLESARAALESAKAEQRDEELRNEIRNMIGGNLNADQ